MKLTPEQIADNAAAYVAQMNGLPFQWYSENAKEWRDDIAGDRSVFWHTENGYLCRPAPIPEPPKPWDSPDDVPGPVCFIRYVTCEETWQIIHGAGRDGIWILLGDNCNPTAHLVSYKTIGESWLYSTTRAKGSWKPCVKSV